MLLLVSIAGTNARATSADEQLRALYEAEYRWRQREFGQVPAEQGGWRDGPALPRVDAATQRDRLAYWDASLAALARIPADALSPEGRINAAVFSQIVQTLADDVRYRTYEAPLNSDTFFWSGLYPRMGGFDTEQAYRDYLRRLSQLPRFFAEHQTNMRAGLARGYSVPRVALEGRERSIEAYLAAGENNPYWAPIAALPAQWPETLKSELQSQARSVIDAAVVPAYSELLRFMREDYLPHTRETLAARDLPDGDAFYQTQIRNFTTLDLTAEEIHATGVAEVARIRAGDGRGSRGQRVRGGYAGFPGISAHRSAVLRENTA